MSFIHSVIVSTNPGPEKRPERKRKKKRKRANKKIVSSDDNISYIPQPNATENVKKKVSRNMIKRNKKKRMLDEGFESHNGNGSSENGDESKNKSMISADNVENNKDDFNTQVAENKKLLPNVPESDTETEPEMVIRRRLPKINISKEDSDTDSDTQLTYKSIASLVSYIFNIPLLFNT